MKRIALITIIGITFFSSGVHADYLLTYRGKGRPCPKSKYRQGDTKRAATDMCAVARKLTEADIEALWPSKWTESRTMS